MESFFASSIFSLNFFDDLILWGNIFWWLLLAVVAWWLYKWAEEHLAFSPLLTFAVAGILIYYLVIDQPVWGISVFIMHVLLFTGILWILPLLAYPFHGLFSKKR